MIKLKSIKDFVKIGRITFANSYQLLGKQQYILRTLGNECRNCRGFIFISKRSKIIIQKQRGGTINMTTNFSNFNEKFKVDDLLIVQTEYWRWSLRPLQCTLGAGILSLKRPAESMSELTPEEGKDLIIITQKIEETLNKAFHMEKMNYIMLMMVDYHIHYHVVPRYAQDKLFAEIEFKDLGWPKPPVLDAEVLDIEILYKIRDYLRSLL